MFITYQRPDTLRYDTIDDASPTSPVAATIDQCGAELDADGGEWHCTREVGHNPHAHHAPLDRGGDGPLGAVGIAWDSESTGLWLNFELNDRGTIRSALTDALALIDSVDQPNDLIGMLVGGGPGGPDSGTFCDEDTVRLVLANR
ncbi:hypothetical protein [uncultured Microbacterium sp.]|uniref:hypothetical protein n=1 Tax=uncultured Microbacterium sp. TaxID=191216 RepID=UPI0025F78CA9|nr:hypothetical protein [uncultured Microbacterium sp.]